MLSLAPLPPRSPPPRNPPLSAPQARGELSPAQSGGDCVRVSTYEGSGGSGRGGGARFPSTAELSVSSPGSIHYSSSCRKSSPAQLQIL